jgi:hypothetical protein
MDEKLQMLEDKFEKRDADRRADAQVLFTNAAAVAYQQGMIGAPIVTEPKRVWQPLTHSSGYVPIFPTIVAHERRNNTEYFILTGQPPLQPHFETQDTTMAAPTPDPSTTDDLPGPSTDLAPSDGNRLVKACGQCGKPMPAALAGCAYNQCKTLFCCGNCRVEHECRAGGWCSFGLDTPVSRPPIVQTPTMVQTQTFQKTELLLQANPAVTLHTGAVGAAEQL